jgi:transposase
MGSKSRANQRLEEITPTTIVVGVDIAKTTHWARFTDFRGIEVSKAAAFKSDRNGFESIIARIQVTRRQFDSVIIGMEPTGHYWKTLANYLMKAGYRVVGVNPYHTKRAGDFARFTQNLRSSAIKEFCGFRKNSTARPRAIRMTL